MFPIIRPGNPSHQVTRRCKRPAGIDAPTGSAADGDLGYQPAQADEGINLLRVTSIKCQRECEFSRTDIAVSRKSVSSTFSSCCIAFELRARADASRPAHLWIAGSVSQIRDLALAGILPGGVPHLTVYNQPTRRARLLIRFRIDATLAGWESGSRYSIQY